MSIYQQILDVFEGEVLQGSVVITREEVEAEYAARSAAYARSAVDPAGLARETVRQIEGRLRHRKLDELEIHLASIWASSFEIRDSIPGDWFSENHVTPPRRKPL